MSHASSRARRGLAALALVVSGGAVSATSAVADTCYNTNWSSYSPRQTFIGYRESPWYNDGAVGDQKYYRQFTYHSGEYKFRQYNCNTQRGSFYNIQYRGKTCRYLTCSGPSSWYFQRVSGPNYLEGILQNGIAVRW